MKMRNVWLAKGATHEAMMGRGRYDFGAFKNHDCLTGTTPDGRVIAGDTHEEIMDTIAGVFAS